MTDCTKKQITPEVIAESQNELLQKFLGGLLLPLLEPGTLGSLMVQGLGRLLPFLIRALGLLVA